MRDINQLHPSLRQKIDELVTLCGKLDIYIGIGECLRTVAEQDALYAKGRTAPGNKVTNCKGSTYSSMHQWGVAFDFYLKMDVDGDGSVADDAFNNSTGLFQKVGGIGKSIGLEWGGDWTSIKDMPHFQLPDWGSTASKLKQIYGTPDAFKATWKSFDSVVPVAPSSPINGVGRVTAKSGLKIRSTTSTSGNGNQVGTIPYMGTCEIVRLNAATGSGVQWASVIYGNIKGYVAQKYLDVVVYPTASDVVQNAENVKDPVKEATQLSGYSKFPVQSAKLKDSKYSGSYSTTANLNLRTGAGTKNTNIILTIPKGDTVKNYGYYTLSGSTVWLLVEYGKYIGYVSMGYLKRK